VERRGEGEGGAREGCEGEEGETHCVLRKVGRRIRNESKVKESLPEAWREDEGMKGLGKLTLTVG